jgi:hypothetical protein
METQKITPRGPSESNFRGKIMLFQSKISFFVRDLGMGRITSIESFQKFPESFNTSNAEF